MAIAIFALAVVSLAVVSRDDGFNSSPTTTSEPTTLAPSPPPEPSPPRPEVSLTPQRSDEWAGGRIDDWVVLFTLSSDHEFSAWRSDDRRATFGVQCRDNNTDAWLETGTHTSIETGDVEIQGGSFGAGPEYGRHIHMIQIRFDGGEVFSEGWVDSTPTPAKVIYAQNAIPLIRRIADAELMIVGFVPQNSDPVRLEFDVRGFDERIGLVADTCNWSVDPTVPPPPPRPPRPQNPAIRLVTEALVGDAYGESDLEVIPNPKGDGVFIYVPASKSEGRTMLWLVIDDTVYALTRDTRNMTDNNLWLVMAPLNRWERTGLRSGVANDAIEIVFGR